MHREESKVNTNEEASEVNFTKSFIISDTDHLFDSVVKTSKDSKNRPHRKDIVEVRNDVVSIVEGDI